jgi:hypothetical protein
VPKRFVLGELPVRERVSNATGNMHEWPFFTKTHSAAKHKHNAQYFTDACSDIKETIYPNTSHNGSHLRNTTAFSQGTNELHGKSCEERAKHPTRDPKPIVVSQFHFFYNTKYSKSFSALIYKKAYYKKVYLPPFVLLNHPNFKIELNLMYLHSRRK